ncbi:DUF2812 domain-containing protein [Anoxynatronum buryatiense]|uniref:DUF2812 domain-containing protein n=1 Tax=Anoxynatronum buryatiense TaxID=489973 RepID=A0AA45WX78_9CLOT|nr:DUF2812 domain-containing protein [Anoxynatronum buryatiense]SMP62801.1 Protein of unknown function [Anoxynatronum buryatiense]
MDTKFQLFPLGITDWAQMEDFFARMAGQGWMIHRIIGGMAIYRKMSPCLLTFGIAIYPESRVFEGFDKSKTQAYIHQAEAEGWQLALSRHNLQVFYRQTEDGAVTAPTASDTRAHTADSLQRSFQMGHVASQLKLETFSLSVLFLLTLFNASRMLPLSSWVLRTNVGLLIMVWFPLFLLFFTTQITANLLSLRSLRQRLTVTSYPRRRPPLQAFLRNTAYGTATLVVFSVVLTLLAQILQKDGRQILLGLLPLFLAMGAALGMRRYFTGKNMDQALKTVLVVVTVFLVVTVTSHLTLHRTFPAATSSLPPEDLPLLTLKDFGVAGTVTHAEYHQQASLLVPHHQQYYETSVQLNMHLTVSEARSPSIAAQLYRLTLNDDRIFNPRLVSAEVDFPEACHAAYFIPVYHASDGSTGGTIIIHQGAYVVQLTLNRDLRDPHVHEILETYLKTLV